MPMRNKEPRELRAHDAAVVEALKARLRLLAAIDRLRAKKVSLAEIRRREKLTAHQLKSLLREDRLFTKYAALAHRIRFHAQGAMSRTDLATWRKLARRTEKQLDWATTPAGLKKTLACDPQEATLLKPAHLYWAAVNVANEHFFAAAKKSAGDARTRNGRILGGTLRNSQLTAA